MLRFRGVFALLIPILALISGAGLPRMQLLSGAAAGVEDVVERGAASPLAQLDAPLPLRSRSVGTPCPAVKDGSRGERARPRSLRPVLAHAPQTSARGAAESRIHTIQLTRLEFATTLAAANAGLLASRSNAPPLS
jgi:hypothetical protein